MLFRINKIVLLNNHTVVKIDTRLYSPKLCCWLFLETPCWGYSADAASASPTLPYPPPSSLANTPSSSAPNSAPPPLTPQLPHTPMTPQSHMGQAPPHSHMSQSPLTPHGHMSPSPMSSHPHTPMMPHTPQSMGQGHSVSNCMKWTNSL